MDAILGVVIYSIARCQATHVLVAFAFLQVCIKSLSIKSKKSQISPGFSDLPEHYTNSTNPYEIKIIF
jgi:hypothetical protein